MKLRYFLFGLLLLIPTEVGEPVIVQCDTDMDCAIKNPLYCGGPYEIACSNPLSKQIVECPLVWTFQSLLTKVKITLASSIKL